MIKVGVIGASGYTGLELLRLLSTHPEVNIAFVTSRQYKGVKVEDAFPAFRGVLSLTFLDPSEALHIPVEIVFTALPHQESMKAVPAILEKGTKVIDLSADFRLKAPELYREFYGPHDAPHLLKESIYGVPELYREEIRHGRLIANPGCYAIASILGLAPLAQKGLLEETVIVDAKSGVSGAGRTPTLTNSFVEVNEAFSPYKVARHRHTPEIEQELKRLSKKKDAKVLFVPHLLPVNRGILATIYTSWDGDEESLRNLYMDFYKEEPFVHILPPERLPNIAYVRGSNYCMISTRVDRRYRKAIIIVAIDNLGKGAAGNAVQIMNIMAHLPEKRGLTQPFYP